MSIPTYDQHDVWSYNDSPEWMEKNFVPDIRIVYGVDRQRADVAAARLAELYPSDTFEVRDVHGTVTDVYGAARGETVRPEPTHRRTLGDRGR